MKIRNLLEDEYGDKRQKEIDYEISRTLEILHDPDQRDEEDGRVYFRTLSLKHASNDFKLPENMTVQRGLDLSGSNITELPKGLEVKLILNLGKCTKLKTLPDDIKVDQVVLRDNTEFESLPENLNLKSLTISNCPKLTKLPKNLNVETMVAIRNTPIDVFHLLNIKCDMLKLNGDTDINAARKKIQSLGLDPDDPIDRLEIAEVLYDTGLEYLIK